MKTKDRPLTDRQKQLLKAVQRLSSELGYPPSMGEVAEVMGVARSRAGALARRLVALGRLSNRPNIPRSWRVL